MAEPVAGLPSHVLVRDSEEKGSDVNLATRLLVDGFNGEYEQAVVVSNDADFSGAMRYVRDDLGLRMTLVNPDARNASPRELADAATYVRRLWKSHLRRSQLPDTLRDEVGVITKPARVVTLAASFYRLSQTPQCPSHSLPNPSAVLPFVCGAWDAWEGIGAPLSHKWTAEVVV